MKIISFLLFFLISIEAYAILNVKVLKSDVNAYPVTIMPFFTKTKDSLKHNLDEIIKNDLMRSGYFKIIEIHQKITKDKNIDFDFFKNKKVEMFSIGSVKEHKNNMYKISFRLFEVYTKRQLIGKSWTVEKTALRRMAHTISNAIYFELLGEKGDFDTHLSYVSVKENENKRGFKYQLEVADSDGFNPQIVLKSTQPILSPSWSPNGKKLAYVTFKEGYSQVYIKHIWQRKPIIKLPRFEGIASAPTWSPDGKNIVLTLSKEGNKDLYMYNFLSQKVKQLTNNKAIDTEANFSPDGQFIVFSSNRANGLQLYRMNLKNRQIKRLTFRGNYNAKAMYAPNGKSIVFVHREYGKYRIALLDVSNVQNREFSVISQGDLDESPYFSSNGSMIIYTSKEKGRSFLSVLSSRGLNSHQLISTQGEVREPSWSKI
jgi:TolB protein